jgi:hypothetical protein
VAVKANDERGMMNDEWKKGSQKPGARSQKKGKDAAINACRFDASSWLLAPDS